MTMKKYLELFEAAPMPTGPAATPSVTAKPATTKSVRPGDASAYVGGSVDATAQIPDTSKAIPGTGSKPVNNPMQDFEEDIEEELAEMMRLSGMSLNEKAPPTAKGERMVKHIKKGYAKDGKLTKKEKSIAYATAWKQHNKEKVTEDVMLDEGGSTLNHIANRFKYEVKMFMQAGVMDNDLYEALSDYYIDRGEVPYGVAKGKSGYPDMTQWVEERFYADMGSGMNESAVTEEPVMDETLNELAILAGLEEDGPGSTMLYNKDKSVADKMKSGADSVKDFVKQGAEAYKDLYMTGLGMPPDKYTPADPNKPFGPRKSEVKEEELTECGDDMDMNQEDSFNVSTNMSSDGNKSVNISAQGDRADELLQMLKMAGMRPHDDHDHSMMSEPEVIMIGSNEMMEQDEFGSKGYVGSQDPRVASYQEFINKTAKITGSPRVKIDGMFGPRTSASSEKTNNFFMHSGRKHPAAAEFWQHQDNLTQNGIEDMEKGITKPTKGPININDKVQEAKKRTTRYSNTPDEEYETVAAITRQGNDLNREKRQYASKPRLGDNPMAESILDADLDAMLESILLRDDDNSPKIKRDPETGRVTATYPAPKKSDQSTLPLQTEPYGGPRSLKVDGEQTGTEDFGKDDEKEVYEEEKPTWLQRQPSKSQEEIAKDWDERVKASGDYVIPAERPYRDEKTGRMITPPKGATNPPPDSEFPPGDKRNMMPPKRK